MRCAWDGQAYRDKREVIRARAPKALSFTNERYGVD
jgi:hypothetical protein